MSGTPALDEAPSKIALNGPRASRLLAAGAPPSANYTEVFVSAPRAPHLPWERSQLSWAQTLRQLSTESRLAMPIGALMVLSCLVYFALTIAGSSADQLGVAVGMILLFGIVGAFGLLASISELVFSREANLQPITRYEVSAQSRDERMVVGLNQLRPFSDDPRWGQITLIEREFEAGDMAAASAYTYELAEHARALNLLSYAEAADAEISDELMLASPLEIETHLRAVCPQLGGSEPGEQQRIEAAQGAAILREQLAAHN